MVSGFALLHFASPFRFLDVLHVSSGCLNKAATLCCPGQPFPTSQALLSEDCFPRSPRPTLPVLPSRLSQHAAVSLSVPVPSVSRAAFEQQWGNYILDAATNETDLYFPIVHSTNSTLLCNGCPYTDMAARGSAVGSAMLKAVRTGRYAAASPSAEMSMLFIPVFPRGFVVAGESPRHVVFSIYAWKYPRSIDPFSLQSLVFCVNFPLF